MLTRKIDAALDALEACAKKVPALAACYRPGTRARLALEEVLEAVAKADTALFQYDAQPPQVANEAALMGSHEAANDIGPAEVRMCPP
jgi:hypothetical protein